MKKTKDELKFIAIFLIVLIILFFLSLIFPSDSWDNSGTVKNMNQKYEYYKNK